MFHIPTYGVRFFRPLILLISIAWLLSGTPSSFAQSTVGCGASELISAIKAANDLPSSNTIPLSAGCIYTLTTVNNPTDGGNGLPVIADTAITGTLTILGNGATIRRSSADGTPDFRILEIAAGGNLTLNDVTISQGSAVIGGGILNYGTLALNNTTVSGNTGGGVSNSKATATISDSTISGNNGSGVGASASTVTIQNSTVSGNTTTGFGGGLAIGFMITNNVYFPSVVKILNSTITGNTAQYGGGIYTQSGVTIGGSIIAGNTAATPDIDPTVNSLGYNIIGSTTGTTITGTTTGNLTDVAAQPLNLGALTNNGGSTETIALLAGSVAINAGDPSFASPPDNDQRGAGFPRVVSGRIDIGAFETGCPTTPSIIPSPIATTSDLISAINIANCDPADNTLNLQPAATYMLTAVNNATDGGNGLPVIAASATAGTLTINGSGATLTRSSVDGTPNFRILEIASGGSLTINGVTVSNGKLTYAVGAGIYNKSGTLTVVNSTFSGNTVTTLDEGGGINSSSGTLTVTNSTFSGNSAGYEGGGIYILGGSAAISSSTFSGNSVLFYGGAVHNALGTLTITDSTLSGNSAASGGAILSAGVNAVLTVRNSTIANNTAHDFGGGIMTNPGAYQNTIVTATISNSTITGNSANTGGGIMNAGTLIVTNSTITGNSILSGYYSTAGGGIFNQSGYVVHLGNSIVAGNTAPTGPDLNGTIDSLGYNAVGNTSGATLTGTLMGNLINAAASPLNLGALANNGGSTQTIALGAGSVAINAGDLIFTPPPDNDQRGAGFPRVVGGQIDIGAFEGQQAVCPTFPYRVPASATSLLVFAIDCANTNGAGTNDVINLTYGIYTLTTVNNVNYGGNGLPEIVDAAIAGTLTINGNGAAIIRSDVAGTPNFRILEIAPGGNLSLNGVTVTNGYTSDTGGAVYNLGVLTINGSTFSANSATSGGAIRSIGTLTVNNSTLSVNAALSGSGGAIDSIDGTLTVSGTSFSANSAAFGGAIHSYHVLTVSSSTFSNNTSNGFGGALFMEGTLTMDSSTLSNNTAVVGGAIYNNSVGSVTLTATTFSNNSASSAGAIANSNGTLIVKDSTFSGNSTTGSGGQGDGGAIDNSLGTVEISNSTFSGNSAPNGAGGAIMSGGTLTVLYSTFSGNSATEGGAIFNNHWATLGSTILAGNTASTSPDFIGTVSSLGYNIIGNTSNMTIQGSTTGNLLDAAASPLNLGALANNGASTRTLALNAGSIAIAHGNCSTLSGVPATTSDQRGMPRKSPCDVGAYEIQQPIITTQPQSQSITSGQTALLSVAAIGAAPLSYQWYQGIAPNTSHPVGTNSASFTTPVLATTTSYWVRVSNSSGHADSNTATLTITIPTDSLAFYNPSSGYISLIDTLQDYPPGSAYTTYVSNSPVLGSGWVMGDWDGDGQKTPGLWSNGAFWFTNGIGPSVSWTGIWIGLFPSVSPVAGRFDTAVNHDCFGVVELDFQPPNVGFPVHYRCDFSTTAGTLYGQWLGVALPGSDPYQFSAGDFDHNGFDSLVAQRGTLIAWGNVTPSTGVGTFPLAQYIGTPHSGTSQLVTGDWNNDGVDSFGLYYPADGSFYRRDDLDWNSGMYILQHVGLPIGSALAASYRAHQVNGFSAARLPVTPQFLLPEATDSIDVTEMVTPEVTDSVEVTETITPEVTDTLAPTETPTSEITETAVPTMEVTAVPIDLPTALPFPTLPPPATPTDLPTALPFPTLPPPSSPTASSTITPLTLPVIATFDDGAPDWLHTQNWQLTAHDSGFAWSMTSTRSETLRWQASIDLRGMQTNVALSFQSQFVGDGIAAVQVSTDNGVTWLPVAAIPTSPTWTTVSVDLSGYNGSVVQIEFTWQETNAKTTDQWAVDNVVIDAVMLTLVAPSETPLPTATETPTTVGTEVIDVTAVANILPTSELSSS